MSSSSIKKPRHQHITDAAVPQHFRRTLDLDEELRDPDPGAFVAFEHQGVLESAERVPKDAARRSKHHYTKLYSRYPPGAVKGYSDSGRRVPQGESGEVNGDAHAYAHKPKDISETKKQRDEEPWHFTTPYLNGKSSAGSLRSSPAYALPLPLMRKHRLLGGPQPTNRLRSTDSQTSTKSKTVAGPFDLTNSSYRPDGERDHPAKRQRVDNTINNISPRDVVNLVEESPASQSMKSRPTARSGYDQSQHQQRYSDSLGINVPEFRKVEESTRIQHHQRAPRKNSTSIESPRGRGSGGNILREEGIKRQKRARESESLDISLNEISDDPIQDDDDQARSKVTQAPKQKSLIQVQIPYTGTAHLRSHKVKDANSKVLARAPADTGRRSPYFPQTSGQPDPPRRSRNADTSDVDEQSRNSHTSEEMGPPKYNPLKRVEQNSAAAAYEDEASLDELAAEPQTPREVARTLLEARRNNTSRLDASKQTHANVEVVESDSDDELSTQRCNINHSEFGSKTGAKIAESKTTQPSKSIPTKKAKHLDTVPRHTYKIVEMFFENKKWLECGSKTWSITHTYNDKTLRVFDEVRSYQTDILTSKVDRIMMNPECSKIIIHKRKDMQDAEVSLRVYLDFGEASQVKEFQERLKKVEGESVKFNLKTVHYLENTFSSNRNKKVEPKFQRRTREEEPEDIRLAKKKQDMKLQGKWEKHCDSTQNVNTRSRHIATDSNDLKEFQRSSGLRKRMETSAMEISDDDAQNLNYNASGIAPSNFYGSGEAEVHHDTRSSSRKYANPPRKARSPTPVLGWTLQNPKWEEGWHSSLVFAGDGKARATIESTDIPKLDEGEFLNDSLIYFYLLYLQKRLADAHPDLAKRIYVQNSFFYERLTKEAKSRINYEGVRKWTDRANVDIFTKDYIIIPVNENLHWYVAIICNAPKLLNPEIELNDPSSQQSTEKSEDHGLEHAALIMTTETSSPPRQVVPGVDAKIAELCLDDASENKSGRSKFDETSNPGPSKEPSPKEANIVPNVDGTDKRKRQNDDDDDNDVAPVISDPLPAPVKASRKGKKGSTGRKKYDPQGPRIITLDSFGHSHSPACSNLKEYLVAEGKEKHSKEISPPLAIGMTAKYIPLQNNYCDCGVFLLGYMERFFENPDGFVDGLLSGGPPDHGKTWVNAPEMRNSIRDILFKLQKEQAPEPGKKKERKKTKAALQSGTIPDSTISSKAISKEASKSARPSVSPEDAKSDRATATIARTLIGTEKSVPLEDPQSKSQTSLLPRRSTHVTPKSAMKLVTPEGRNHRKSEIAESDVEDPGPPTKASPSPAEALEPGNSHTMLGNSHEDGAQFDQSDKSFRLMGMWADRLKFWKKKSDQDEVANSGATESNPLEIEDSQTSIAYEPNQVSKPRSPIHEQKYVPMVEDEYTTSNLHSQQIPPDADNYFGTEPSLRRGSSDEAIESPSSVGLDEPFTNKSSSRTATGAFTAGNEPGNEHNDEMLLAHTVRHTAASSSRSPSSLARATSLGKNHSKKRYHSEAPETKKRLRVEEVEKNSNFSYHEMERDLRGSSEGSVEQIKRQWPGNDVKASNSRSSIGQNGGTHTKFEE